MDLGTALCNSHLAHFLEARDVGAVANASPIFQVLTWASIRELFARRINRLAAEAARNLTAEVVEDPWGRE